MGYYISLTQSARLVRFGLRGGSLVVNWRLLLTLTVVPIDEYMLSGTHGDPHCATTHSNFLPYTIYIIHVPPDVHSANFTATWSASMI